jgi:conjugal transfer pilus assembly protein TraW
MRLLLAAPIALIPLAGIALALGAMRGEARDFGQAGQVFPVIEPDLLATIEARLRRAEASGELARTNADFARRVEAKVRRPDPVAGITPARAARSWDFDPAVTLERDIRDSKGNRIAAAGQKLNPLDFVSIRQDLVFIDGDSAEELAWATARYSDLEAKLIFVRGSPIAAMTAKKRRIYFDQQGRLVNAFGIAHTPAVVTQAGKVMRVTEIVVKRGSAG